jgi:hypothetical protein
MTSWQATSEDGPTGRDGGFRAVGLTAVCIGVAALAGATFVLSYQGIREVALQAGIEPRYARGYPLLIDAMLVIVLAAVLALRGAGMPSRMLSWLTLLVVLGAAAGADTLHATGRTLPHNTAVITAAVLPWALVFVAFVLLLAMLRHARLRRQARAALAQPPRTQPVADGQAVSQQGRTALAPPLPVRTPQSWQSVSIVPGFSSQLVSGAAAGAAAGTALADVEPVVEDVTAPDDADDHDGAADQEVTAAEPAEPVTPATATDAGYETGVPIDDIAPADEEADLSALAAGQTAQTGEAELQGDEDPETAEDDPHNEAETQTGEAELQGDEDPVADDAPAQTAEDDDDMPVFHRIRSSPTPPEE